MTNYGNTTKKGDAFEKIVFDIIAELVESGNFCVPEKKSKVYWKKSYYSQKTERKIVVDISIEVFMDNAETYSNLIIIECKNYNTSVPINDIREFGSILNEIGEHNTKGIFIVNSSFQKGTLKFAENTGIGLGRINIKNGIDWINYRKDRKITSYEHSIVESKLYNRNLESNFFASYGNKGYEIFTELLIDIGAIDFYSNKLKYVDVPFKSKDQIAKKIKEIPSHLIYSHDSKLITENICNYLKNKYQAKFYLDNLLRDDILGKIHFSPLEIHISKILETNSNRWRFTLAHEIGHLVLHKNLLENYFDEKNERDNNLELNQSSLFAGNKYLEIQANTFASILLMPYNQLMQYVEDYFRRENIYKGHLFLDNQYVNRRLVLNFLGELQKYFGVSKEVAKYRLIGLGILRDVTNISVGNIIRNRF